MTRASGRYSGAPQLGTAVDSAKSSKISNELKPERSRSRCCRAARMSRLRGLPTLNMERIFSRQRGAQECWSSDTLGREVP